MNDKSIGDLIKNYRQKANLTQQDLANQLRLGTAQFVSLFERGHSKVPLETLGQIVKLLNIPDSKVKKILLSEYEKELTRKIDLGRQKISRIQKAR